MTDAAEPDPESPPREPMIRLRTELSRPTTPGLARHLTCLKRGLLLRPVHPDTLAFICDSAGFASAEIRRLSPVPEADLLPTAGPDGGPLADHLDRVVGRLNALLYGFQDYAVVARR